MKQIKDEAMSLLPTATPAVRAADQIYRRLRTAIMDGGLPARTRLVELELAAKLEVSRTPVREAISRLINDQLVQPLPYGGVEVVDMTHELEDIYAIREALEGTAARLAAERITDEEVQELQAIQDRHRALELNDYERRTELNNLFHGAILKASRAPRLIHMVEGFQEFFLHASQLLHYQKRHTQTALKQHQEIIDALRARDGKRAEKLVRSHLLYSLNRALDQRRHTGNL
ncbi:GntR family transcriptional regulator [Parapusillimonas granuli]|uniref:GntR family transcriptional regulator n=1 Tax=Parapusillimonas granuli TaxID=380911 RepID=A0A853G9J3_9BURK|nr:GntR family transcriptional regulator [Parapusillimonas granuli]MBB5214292.1 DNA-binding GntR family transcriptional regulator [Parapusillimonas granuli]NYT51396.1 GntR family transcriptional regulator [Parapusillimonas granuli]